MFNIAFQTEAGYDYTYLYNGLYSCSSATLLNQWDDHKPPEYFYFDIDQLSVRFTSDQANNKEGFAFEISLASRGRIFFDNTTLAEQKALLQKTIFLPYFHYLASTNHIHDFPDEMANPPTFSTTTPTTTTTWTGEQQ